MGSGIIIEDIPSDEVDKHRENFSKVVRPPSQFASLSKVIMRDLNKVHDTVNFHKYTKQQIVKFLQDPVHYEKQLREACIDIYTASSHFRRLISYFVSLSDLSYVIVPSITSRNKKST